MKEYSIAAPLLIAASLVIWLVVMSMVWGTVNAGPVPQCMEDEAMIAANHLDPDAITVDGVARRCINWEELVEIIGN